jgi:hypothetical protein
VEQRLREPSLWVIPFENVRTLRSAASIRPRRSSSRSMRRESSFEGTRDRRP